MKSRQFVSFQMQFRQLTYNQRLCKLHGDKGLTWEAFHSPRLIVNFDSGQFNVDLSLNKVPLIVIQSHRRVQGHIEDAIAHHK